MARALNRGRDVASFGDFLISSCNVAFYGIFKKRFFEIERESRKGEN